MRRTIILLSASLLTLAACTDQNNGTPTPANSTSSQEPSSADSSVPGPGVPKVQDPIDIKHFKQAPCDSLTTEQVTALLGQGVSPKSDPNGSTGPECFWHSASISQAGVGLIFPNVDNLGLTSVYAAKGATYPFFRPLEPINGYPIVAYSKEKDPSSEGRCTVALGTSDRETADITVTLSEQNIGKDPCAAAHDVAAKVLGNLRAVR